jgi:hypothetical protein
MLNPELARQQLQELRDSEWRSTRLRNVAQRARPLLNVGLALFGLTPRAQPPATPREYDRWQERLGKLAALSRSDRLKLFTAFFPQFAPTMEAAWQSLATQPYQGGPYRRPFRLPEPIAQHHLGQSGLSPVGRSSVVEPNIRPDFYTDRISERRIQWLLDLVQLLEGYDQGLPWIATWLSHLSPDPRTSNDCLGVLLAAAIDSKEAIGTEVYEILHAAALGKTSALGEPAISGMSRSGLWALLIANQPEGWAFVEGLLVAAQRQEGLRQVILETVDVAHPAAFQRMLRLILTEDLTRFSAVTRAMSVWLGYGLEGGTRTDLKPVLQQILNSLERPESRVQQLVSADAEAVYLTLWAIAFEDVAQALEAARPLLQHTEASHRLVAAHLLGQLQWAPAYEALLPLLADADMGVVAEVLQALETGLESGYLPLRLFESIEARDLSLRLGRGIGSSAQAVSQGGLFEQLEAIAPRFPVHAKTLQPLVWPWEQHQVSQAKLGRLLYRTLGTRSPQRLLAYFSRLDSALRAQVVRELAALRPWTLEVRSLLVQALADGSVGVRAAAIEGLGTVVITVQEAAFFESLLDCKTSDLRQGVLILLLNQSDTAVLASVQRLLATAESLQRQAGLELALEMVRADRLWEQAARLALTYRDLVLGLTAGLSAHPSAPLQLSSHLSTKLSAGEARLLEALSAEVEPGEKPTVVSLGDALGLAERKAMTSVGMLKVKREVLVDSAATRACLNALDELVHQHRQTPIKTINNQGEEIEVLLGNVTWNFPTADSSLSEEENEANLPLADVWLNWWHDRDETCRDEDGMELVRAMLPRYRESPQPRTIGAAPEDLGHSGNATNPGNAGSNAGGNAGGGFAELDRDLLIDLGLEPEIEAEDADDLSESNIPARPLGRLSTRLALLPGVPLRLDKSQRTIQKTSQGIPSTQPTGQDALKPKSETKSAWDDSSEGLVQEALAIKLRQDLVLAFQASSGADVELRYPHVVESILSWLFYLDTPPDSPQFALEAIIDLFYRAPIEVAGQAQVIDRVANGEDLAEFVQNWVDFVRQFSPAWNPQQDTLWWHLVTRIERSGLLSESPVDLFDVLAAYQVNGIKEADVIFHLLGDPSQRPGMARRTGLAMSSALVRHNEATSPRIRQSFEDLTALTARLGEPWHREVPVLMEIVDRCRQRVLAIELNRGELPTVATQAALALGSISGIATITQLLRALDPQAFVPNPSPTDLSKAAVLSHLVRICFPAHKDNPDEFVQRVKSARIESDRLMALALYAPQWAAYVEKALGWPGFAEGVWWIHAHSINNQNIHSHLDPDIQEIWTAQILERTGFSIDRFADGDVDISWFRYLYSKLKSARWASLQRVAQSVNGKRYHQRALLFSEAMLGNLEVQDLRQRIDQHRQLDAVRALGLVPLSRGKKRSQEILDRYEYLQAFLRSSRTAKDSAKHLAKDPVKGQRQSSSQRQAKERLAVTIALDNLAYIAGYPDTQRLQWAMEIRAIADLVRAPQVIHRDDLSVSLAITPQGQPEITVKCAGKALKAIPARLKQDPEIQAVVRRKQEIIQQASRMRAALELAMVRGDSFNPGELKQLLKHPVLAPFLRQLLWVGDVNDEEFELGYLAESGQALQWEDGSIVPRLSEALRIAHPYDLLVAGEWIEWQADCFNHQRCQPFKQIFRELYVPTANEQNELESWRYEGQQVNPKQATAILAQRGWVAGRSSIRRMFYHEDLIAEITLVDNYHTPAAMESWTIGCVRFFERGGDGEPLPLVIIPPQLWSEVMRDVDLVVSVAHQGGVDPEASASTIEMRTTIVRETCRLMKLHNVHIQGPHALIEGELGSYSVHLGGGIVHRQPGGALCIVPVHAQHQGRIFLPFMDSDPKTAEVVSKVLLLAKDAQIQDPTILEQLRSPLGS